MIAQLARRITYLQNCCKLCLLAHSCSDGQAEYLRTLSAAKPVDLSEPAVRSRALSCPAEFLRLLGTPAMLQNLQYVPELVPFLLTEDMPNGSYIAAATQLYPLLPFLKQYGKQIARIELPLQSDEASPLLRRVICKEIALLPRLLMCCRRYCWAGCCRMMCRTMPRASSSFPPI